MASVDDLIDGFYEAAVRPEILPETVLAARDFFRSTACGLYVQNLNQKSGRMAGAEAAIAMGFGAGREQQYWDYYYARNPMFELTKMLGTSRVVTETDLALLSSSPRFDEGEFYEDWVRPQGFRHIMGEFVDRRNDGVLVIAVWRQAREGAFGADETGLFGRLNRHIARAIDVGERLHALEGEMSALMARSASAVFTIGRDGRLRQCNAAADALLKAGTALRCSGARLRTAFAEDQAAFDRLVACALEPRFAPWAENAAVSIRRRDGKPAVVARAIAVAQRFSPFAPDRPASAILTVEGFDAEDEAVEAHLRRRLGLTPAQARVAREFRAGRSPAEVARALNVSVETVRTHLKVLFERTGTHRQSELVLHLRSRTGV